MGDGSTSHVRSTSRSGPVRAAKNEENIAELRDIPSSTHSARAHPYQARHAGRTTVVQLGSVTQVWTGAFTRVVLGNLLAKNICRVCCGGEARRNAKGSRMSAIDAPFYETAIAEASARMLATARVSMMRRWRYHRSCPVGIGHGPHPPGPQCRRGRRRLGQGPARRRRAPVSTWTRRACGRHRGWEGTQRIDVGVRSTGVGGQAGGVVCGHERGGLDVRVTLAGRVVPRLAVAPEPMAGGGSAPRRLGHGVWTPGVARSIRSACTGGSSGRTAFAVCLPARACGWRNPRAPASGKPGPPGREPIVVAGPACELLAWLFGRPSSIVDAPEIALAWHCRSESTEPAPGLSP